MAHIAYDEIGKVAGWAAIIAILFILVIALAGLGRVVVNALGGGVVPLPAGSKVSVLTADVQPAYSKDKHVLRVPAGSTLIWNGGKVEHTFSEPMQLKVSQVAGVSDHDRTVFTLSPDAARIIPGSPWGTFTIACTIPIALFVGLYMNKLRKGRVVEASIIGGVLILGATVSGEWIAEHSIGQWFNLSGKEVVWAMAIYGFVASVLPVWLLLAPRDYLSSFLKIGTIFLLVAGVILANPKMQAPAYNAVFAGGGPIVGSGSAAVPGRIFPFLFITIMCGAISGFHSLVSSGTTPKMIRKESECADDWIWGDADRRARRRGGDDRGIDAASGGLLCDEHGHGPRAGVS